PTRPMLCWPRGPAMASHASPVARRRGSVAIEATAACFYNREDRTSLNGPGGVKAMTRIVGKTIRAGTAVCLAVLVTLVGGGKARAEGTTKVSGSVMDGAGKPLEKAGRWVGEAE